MSKMIIGIDPSINSTGLCVYNPGTKFATYFIITPKIPRKRPDTDYVNYLGYNKYETKGLEYSDKERSKIQNIIQICARIKQICDTFNITDAVMEGVSYGSTGSGALVDLAGLNFAIRLVLLQMNINLTIVAPTELKKFAVANGGASKEQMVDAWLRIDTKMTKEHIKKNDDLADAFFLARYTQRE